MTVLTSRCTDAACACSQTPEADPSSVTGCCANGSLVAGGNFIAASPLNTLAFNAERCINCGMCSAVCPHGVFVAGEKIVHISRPDACMECGACQLNCPVGALQVDSGVGCAAAMINAALRGLPEPSCGGDDSESCCG